MVRRIELIFVLSALLAATCVTGRSLRQDGPIGLPTTNFLSQDSQEPSDTVDVSTSTSAAGESSSSGSDDSSSLQSSSTWVQPQNFNHTWPAHNYTLPENVTVEIVIEHKEKEEEEEVPECSGAAASCCHQTLNVIHVDEDTTIPVPGQTCTFTKEIVKVITPACADIHCWWNCGHKCAEKAVVETLYVNQTLNLLIDPYPPATWAFKEEAHCVCPEPVEQEVTITAAASASASTHH
ncbi:hypothetical protein Ndes2526B_g03450 [Nannochloris sp. 'desiccata']